MIPSTSISDGGDNVRNAGSHSSNGNRSSVGILSTESNGQSMKSSSVTSIHSSSSSGSSDISNSRSCGGDESESSSISVQMITSERLYEGKQPEYIPDDDAPLPPGSVEERNNMFDQKIHQKNSNNKASSTNMEYIKYDTSPLPPGAIEMSCTAGDKMTTKKNHQSELLDTPQPEMIEADVEAAIVVAGISHVSEPPRTRQKILYQSESQPVEHGSNQTLPIRSSLLKYIPRLHPSDDMDDVPIPTGRRKLRNLMATVVTAFVIVAVFVITLVSSQSKGNDTITTNTSTQDNVTSILPPQKSPTQTNNYNYQVCDLVLNENDTEFCTAANCFSGPFCSCEIFFRESVSNDVIGVCNSCKVCDFDGNIGYDCSNLGSSVLECPALDNDNEVEDTVIYSPPESYSKRFCSPGLDPTSELCFAGECTNGENCQCDMYQREVTSSTLIGICDSCDICSDGTIASNCTNLGLIEVNCKSTNTVDEKEIKQAYVPPDSYKDRFCFQAFDPSAEICFAGECTNGEDCQCDMYKKSIESEDVIGVCNGCSICADGGVSHDCTNVGATKVTCRNYDSYIEAADQEESNIQLSQGNPDGTNGSVQEPGISTSTSTVSYSDDDYICADPSNGIQLCQAQTCEVRTSSYLRISSS